MKLCTIVGARPQFVKAAPVSRAIAAFNSSCPPASRIHESLIHTGQHFDDAMSAAFWRDLGLPAPSLQLVTDRNAQDTLGAMIDGLIRGLSADRPDVVLVYGDANSAFAGAVAASALGVPIAHVEAGLRSGNRAMREERNRVAVDHLADQLFCPTRAAVEHLCREHISDQVHLVGDVMLEALQSCLPLARTRTSLFDAMTLTPGDYYLATIHRAETTDDREQLAGVLTALSRLDRTVVFPCHPRTRKMIDAFGLGHLLTLPHMRPLDPVGYLDMLRLEAHALCVLTDSGGVQREACWLGVPAVTLRSETEWPETVDAGWNVIGGVEPDGILAALTAVLRVPERASIDPPAVPASETIVRTIAARHG